MNITKFFMTMAAICACMAVSAQGIEFQTKPYSELLKMAKEQDKLIFVDVFTSWCGPCKNMAKNIFTQEKAGEFYNPNFINLQVDAENSEDGKQIAKDFMVTAYPTFLFINGDGELVYRFLGGRDIDKFVAEGETALRTLAIRPQLKECEKKYNAGNRDKDFLDEYCALLDKSGVDYSGILLEYFSKLSDANLLDSVQVDRISDLAVYDRDFTDRIVNVVVKDTAELKSDKKRMTAINKAVCSYMSSAINDIIRKADDSGFENLMDNRERYFNATGNRGSIAMAALGGGKVYLPATTTRLEYYAYRQNKDKFNPLFRDYMVELQKKHEDNVNMMKQLEAEMEKKLNEMKETGDSTEYKDAKMTFRMSMTFAKMDDSYIASQMVDNIGHYADFYDGEKDDAYKKQIGDWYVQMCRFSPSAKTSLDVSDKLVQLGRKDDAVAMLKLGIDEGSDAFGVEKKDVEAVKAKIAELQK